MATEVLRGKEQGHKGAGPDRVVPDAAGGPLTLEQLLEAEWKEIQGRRAAVGLPAEGDSPRSRGLVGLALSGGGVRSSMFNIGVLQALHRSGTIRYVDYLVTVSGGGFIGGFVTARLNNAGQAAEDGEAVLRDKFPLARDPEREAQNSAVVRLTRNGGYLNAPADLALRVVNGVFWHVLILGSLLIFTSALLAWLWRVPDSLTMQRFVASSARWLDAPKVMDWVPGAWAGYGAFAAVVFGLAMLYRWPKLVRDRYCREWASRVTGSSRASDSWTGLGRSLLFAAVWAIAAMVFVLYEGGFVSVFRDWYLSSDLMRGLMPLFGWVVLLGVLRNSHQAWQARRIVEAEEAGEAVKPEPEPERWYHKIPWYGRRVRSLVVPKIPVLTACLVVICVLNILANGDTDLGPRLGGILGRYVPQLGQPFEGATGASVSAPYQLSVRNNTSVSHWLGTVSQIVLTLQLVAGVIPLLLPKQFALSGQAPKNSFQGIVYRAVVFSLFVSLPLLMIYMFLHENVSNSLKPAPGVELKIQRLGMGRDPWTGWNERVITLDQWTRFRWIVTGLAGLILLNAAVDLNRTSLHRFYRERLKRAYFFAFDGQNDPYETDGRLETRLRDVTIDRSGAPYHVISATMSEVRPGVHSLDASCNFVFTPRYCGWTRYHPGAMEDADGESRASARDSFFVPTERYGQSATEGLRLVDAMAISGAAISPGQATSVFEGLLLMAVNARLGQWLPNPAVPENRLFDEAARRGHGIPRLSARALAVNTVKEPRKREFCFLSDGAHHDNLGLELLFERGCRLILVSDVSHDPRYVFSDLVKTLRRLRATHGIRFSLESPEPGESCLIEPSEFLIAGKEKADARGWKGLIPAVAASPPEDLAGRLCRAHALVFRFWYPDDDPRTDVEGRLVVLKPSLMGDEDRSAPGLLSYARAHSAFPMDPDVNQFFDESQCEFYRDLGEHVASSILEPGAVTTGTRTTGVHEKTLWDEKIGIRALIGRVKLWHGGRVEHVSAARHEGGIRDE